MHFLPILYSSCWIVSQSHASLHIIRGEKQIFTITAEKKKNMKKKTLSTVLYRNRKLSREAQMAQSSTDTLAPSPACQIPEKQIPSMSPPHNI